MSLLEEQANRPQSIWHNNPILVQLLGLSPVLAVSTTVVNGVGMGLATAIIMVISCTTAALMKSQLNTTWRFAWFLIIVAFYTTALDILMQWFYFPLYKQLGIYVPLICCNIAILIRMEVHASKSTWSIATLDAAKVGFAYFVTFVIFSAMREFISQGTLLQNWQLLVPAIESSQLPLNLSQSDSQFSFAKLQAIALILLGLSIAAKNVIDTVMGNSETPDADKIVAVQRARVTGRLKK